MAAGSGGKRKRQEKGQAQDEGSSRPSPYRPENTSMAQETKSSQGRGGRGGNRKIARQDRAQSPADGPSATSTPQPTQSAQTPQQSGTPAPGESQANTPLPKTDAAADKETMDAGTNSGDGHMPFAFEHLTDELVNSWDASGKQTTVELFKSTDLLTTGSLIQELVRSGLDGRISAVEAGNVIQQAISNNKQNGGVDAQSLFLSALSLLDATDMQNHSLLALVSATNIDPEIIRLDADIPLLRSLDLVREAFTTMRTRKVTNILYRQANFNLLREETEGYAKVMTEYFNTAQASHSHDSPEMAEAAFQRVKALVGSFDLDVGRVLDITLDISANLLVRVYHFFVQFYRCSSWWPDLVKYDNLNFQEDGFTCNDSYLLSQMTQRDLDSEQVASKLKTRDSVFWERVQSDGVETFLQLGARRILDYDSIAGQLEKLIEPQFDTKGREMHGDRRKRINEDRQFMKETKTLPPIGNVDAAQLLGFKLRFYASPARDAQDVLPENLMALAAMLIKIGFISLRDLYPHLSPADDKMPEERTRLEKEKAEREAKERPGGGLNALSMAGALADDTVPAVRTLRADKEKSGGSTPKPDKKDEELKQELPIPGNQKIMLLKFLLLTGALPEALHILSRFPWLPDVDPSIPPLLNRIARRMLSEVAQSVQPLSDREDVGQQAMIAADTTHDANGKLRFEERQRKIVNRWLGDDKVDNKTGISFKFYYGDWADNIPVCRSLEDVFLLCNTFLGFIGPKIGLDNEVLGVLLRLAKKSLDEDGAELNKARWLELMKRLLVPALSLTKHNPEMTQLVYDLLMQYPIATRYNVYAELYLGKSSRLSDVRAAFTYNRAEAKDVLRRVTNETGKKDARALAKISFSSPGVVMMYMINQLESYSNMIPALVDCVRFLPAMAWDVLTWCLINSLSGQGKNRMQADGMLTSPWLQALSRFVAMLFTRYSAVNPAPVLQYLAFELRNGNSTDLEMFEQVLAEMAGIKAEMQFNDYQVQAMSSGETLQSIILQQLGDTRHTRKPTAKRLVKALAEPGLIGQLLISISQEKQMYQHHAASADMPLKVLGNNVDKIQQILAQYLEVLKTNLPAKDFEEAVPDVVTLIETFGIEPMLAMTLCRTAISHRIAEHDEAVKKRKKTSDIASGDTEMADADSGPATNGDTMKEVPTAAGDDLAVKDMDVDQATPQPPQSLIEENISLSHPVLGPIIDRVRACCPDLASRVSIPFYVRFWTLSQADVLVVTDIYKAETDRLAKQMAQQNRERNDSSVTVKEKERKKKVLQDLTNDLQRELNGRVVRYAVVTRELSYEKKYWFEHKPGTRAELNKMHYDLLQECFIPRAMMSALDAHFSFTMIKALHDKGVPNFSTAALFSALFQKKELAALMFQCTALEAQHFGRFLHEILKLLAGWHKEKDAYEKGALGLKKTLPGFARQLGTDATPTMIDYEAFRRLVFNYHSNLYNAISSCFGSGEYAHVRNAIIVLKAVSQTYPQINFHANGLWDKVQTLASGEERQDLKIMALSLQGPLKKRKEEAILLQAFRLSDKPAMDATTKSAAGGKDEAATSGPPKLNATATEFKPTSSAKEPTSAVEDGELKDDKQAAKGSDKPEEGRSKPLPPSTKDKSSAATGKATPVKPTPAASTPRGPPVDRPKRPESKPSTPAPIPPRPQPAVNDSARSARAAGLPIKPETPDLRRSVTSSGRPHERSGRRDEGYGRLSQSGDFRPGSREQSPGRQRGRTPPPPSRLGPSRDERAPQRPSRDDSSAPRRDPRDQAVESGHRPPPGPDSRDRPNGVERHSSHNGRANPTAPSAQPVPPRGPPSGPASSESGYHENPERLAAINARQDNRDVPRGHRAESGRPAALSERNARPSEAGPPTGPRSGRPREMAPPESSYGRLNGPDPHYGSHSTAHSSSAPSPSNSRPTEPNSFRGQAAAGRTSSAVASTPALKDATPVPAIHPSRLAHISDAPAPQTNGTAAASSPTAPPSGPKNSSRAPVNAPTGPSPSSNGPPTGPATERRSIRSERTGPRSNVAMINATLDPAGRGGLNIRGQAARGPSVNTSTNAGTPPAVASPIEAPSRRPDNVPGRPDSRGGDFRPQADVHGNDSRMRRQDDPRHRGSRNSSRERRHDDGFGRRTGPSTPADDGRDKRGMMRERGPEQEAPRGHGHRDESGRRGGPDAAGYPPPPQWGGERRADDGRRGGRPSGQAEDYRMGRREEDRRVGPPAPTSGGGHHGPDGLGDSGRKRRYEDSGNGQMDPSKRRRSGR